jgi:predicted small secreted protein
MKKNIRTIAIASTLVVTALGLSACSTGTGNGPLAKSGSNAESVLIADYEGEFGNIDSATEGALVDLAWTVCGSLGNGADFYTIIQSANGTGMGGYEAGYIIGASVSHLCPEYTDEMDSFLAANGY